MFCALLSLTTHSVAAEAEPARTVPTFHCMSLYWPRTDGAFSNRCEVRYRKSGAGQWREGHELWWDQTHKFYAGAVVNLEAGTDYEFRLTLLCPGGEEGAGFCWAYVNDYKQINVGRGIVDDGNFTLSRNNICQTIRWPDDVNNITRRIHGGFSFDDDLYNGVLDTNIPEAVAMWGQHAIRGAPRYREGHGTGHHGRAQLTAESPGKDAGCRIPNFNDDYEGGAPDIGAHEHGAPDMKLGVRAYRELYGRP